MTDLRLDGRTDDGLYLSLRDQEGEQYTLRISDTLRATVNQQRLNSVPDNDEPSISIKEIQRLLRTGQTSEQISREYNVAIEKIERFAGPILSERIYIIDQAQQIVVRKEIDRDPVNLVQTITSRLAPRGIDASTLSWDTWRLENGTWTVELHYPQTGGVGVAQWSFDPLLRSLTSMDENARWMRGDDPAPRQLSKAGLVTTESTHPSERRNPENHGVISIEKDRFNEFEDLERFEDEKISPLVPRLAVIREEPDDEASRDGITARAKVPSWDEIMFGIKPEDK
uniref:septation protein SepH n=1 Tax=Candidatus Planktophila sp. TaxID=2175601 RepID=UPI00404B4420